MIASFSRGFVFVKGRKVAGTSVEIGLSTLCRGRDIVTPITPRDEKIRLRMGGAPMNFAHDPGDEAAYVEAVRTGEAADLATIVHPPSRFRNHMALTEILACAPEVKHLRTVFVERNPYAKVLSMAVHDRTFEDYRRGGEMRLSEREIRSEVARMIEEGRLRKCLNIDLYRDGSGRIGGTRLRYEHLEEDLAALAGDIGCPGIPLPRAKQGLRSNRLDPTHLLTRAQLDAINTMFSSEFETFGYTTL